MEYRIGEVEMKFAEMIWEKAPVPSGELARDAAKKLEWKKSTTYTVLKRLCDKGLFTNEKGIVSANVSYEDFMAKQSEIDVEESFKGSLPGFVAAFCSRKKLSPTEIEELQKIIQASQQE
jgi:predicted transcriptional regulator